MYLGENGTVFTPIDLFTFYLMKLLVYYSVSRLVLFLSWNRTVISDVFCYGPRAVGSHFFLYSVSDW